MFNSAVLEVAIGLVFCYASLSIVVSSINEAIASLFKLRARTLLDGIKSLLNDPAFTGLARDLYNHALVNPRDSGNARTEKDLVHKPSYVPARHFALAVIDVLEKAPQVAAQLEQAITVIQDPQLRQLLQGMYRRAAGDLEKFRDDLAAWFDNGMERVAGGYKRRSQLICFLIALAIACLFNIDTFHMFKTLWEHPAFVAEINALQGEELSAAVNVLKALPVGWESFPPRLELSGDSFIRLVGWLLTASSALFGAPFWFDLLQKVVQLRGTGGKPAGTEQTGRQS
jgi:hypothetical protein